MRPDRFLQSSILGAVVLPATAYASPGAYTNVDATSTTALRATLHDAIDDHTRIDYSDNNAVDCWDVLSAAEEDPGNPFNVLDVYKNASYPTASAGNPFWNREHAWPKSYGFPRNLVSNYPYTDCHALFASDRSYNSSRNNKPYGYCTTGCTEKPTLFNNNAGGGTGPYPGNSNWTNGAGIGVWETWIGRRGDVARALMYMDVRYEGGAHSVTGHNEPDLILTDNLSLLVSNTQQNLSVGYMGSLSVLLEWHRQDPVDAVERNRNDAVATHQGNRNPFIDHPEWAECLFLDQCDVAWINEVHYDPAGGDTGEFVEVAARAGTD
ncbi:MAG: endonuclease, partial [Planctomycetota bacterium]